MQIFLPTGIMPKSHQDFTLRTFGCIGSLIHLQLIQALVLQELVTPPYSNNQGAWFYGMQLEEGPTMSPFTPILITILYQQQQHL